MILKWILNESVGESVDRRGEVQIRLFSSGDVVSVSK